MFLQVLQRRNQKFIQAAASLHQAGLIPPNCYVLDLDTIEENARIIAKEAQKYNMKVLAMSKQIGRNPDALDTLVKAGITSYVAVDSQGAFAIHRAGHKVGHIGHLVQIAKAEIESVVNMEPDYWTTFSIEQTENISQGCQKSQREQKVMARIYAEGDTFYRGHEGGFPARKIVEIADRLHNIDHIRFAGITSFPALLFNPETQKVESTPNLTTLRKAAEALRAAGWNNLEINTPGTTASTIIPLLAEAGSTQVEPGHGLTGSTPWHAVEDLPEKPALLYVSEISHIHEGSPFCFGGGLYIDPVFPDYQVTCLVGKDPDEVLQSSVNIEFPASNAIDYYGLLHPEKHQKVRIGDTVILGFRAQIFVTRAYVAGVAGVSQGKPEVKGITTASGRRVVWP